MTIAIQVPIGDIILDPRLQMRAKMDFEVIDEYAEQLDKLPPCKIVMGEGGKMWLTGGWHRYHGHQKAKRETVPCDVREGTFLDALVEACGENEGHGIRRTIEDKRRAVNSLLSTPEWADRSDRMIADACRVDHKFVGSLRTKTSPKTEGNAHNSTPVGDVPNSNNGKVRNEETKRQGKDGKEYSSTKPKNEPILCDRCKRVGAAKDCSACSEARAKAKEEKKPTAKPKKLSEEVDEELGKEEEEKHEPTLDEIMKDKNAEIESFCRELMKLVNDKMPVDAWLDQNNRRGGAIQKFKDGCETLRSCKCTNVCPMCKGDRCAKCHKTGRVNKMTYAQLVS